MILDNHYAVVFKPSGSTELTCHVLTFKAWEQLQELAKAGHFVILEAWDITKGKCISNKLRDAPPKRHDFTRDAIGAFSPALG